MAYGRAVEFWQSVQNDKELQEEIKLVARNPKAGRPEGVVKLGQERGFSFTTDELLEIEGVLAFWRKVHADSALQNKLQNVQEQPAEAAASSVVRIGKETGFSFTEGALEAVTKAQVQAGELSDAELETVTGGALSLSYNMVLQKQWSSAFTRFGPGSVAEYM